MRLFLHILLPLVLVVASVVTYSQPCNMQGAYTIGPGGNYPTLSAALTALRQNGVSNHVFLELQAGYTSNDEVFPLRFNRIPCIDSTKSVTVRPAAGHTGANIFGNVPVLIDLDSAKFIKIDGRPGGVGTERRLSLTSQHATGVAVRFINDACWNELSYLDIYGRNSSTTSGVVAFLGTNVSPAKGNSYNRILNCVITKGGANPVNCVYALGTDNKKNSENEIANCNISDYYRQLQNTSGIYLGKNNSAWRFLGNSFYHTTQLDFSGSFLTHLYINDSLSSGFRIENNFFGGSAPNCGGVPMNYAGFFNAARLWVGKSDFTSVQGNTIMNYNISLDAGSAASTALHLATGKFKCGTVTGNTIGSLTIPNSIQLVSKDFNGILAGPDNDADTPLDTCYIENNTIAGIYSYSRANNFSGYPVKCIYVPNQKAGAVYIRNNLIGSETVRESIKNTTYDSPQITGIEIGVRKQVPVDQQPHNTVENNIIQHFSGNPLGIIIGNGQATVRNNTVRNLYGPTRGIVVNTGRTGSIISGNVVHSLTSASTSTNTLSGFEVENCGGAIVSKNYVHSLQSVQASENNLVGMVINTSPNAVVVNNMIRLGMDTLGNAVNNNQKIWGLHLLSDNILLSNNSIYIGANGTGESAALMVAPSVSAPGNIINNIIANKRSAISGAPRNHYAVRIDNSAANLSGFNYNVYHAGGTNSYLGIFKGVVHSTISSWRTAVKADSSSVFAHPNFVNPEGTAATGDLHVQNPTPVEAAGIANAFVTDDFDNQNRSSLTPVDIGADAGNFIFKDGEAPAIQHAAFLGQPATASVIYQAQITDLGRGVDTANVNKPRMWFRKKNPTPGAWSSNAGNFLSGTINNGTYGFTPNFTAAGITLVTGDTIEYYFVAQDKEGVPNVGYSNLVGTVHTNVNVQVTAPAIPLQFFIYGLFPDTVYVGAGQTYTSLTNTGGFFQAAQTTYFDSSKVRHTVIIVSDLMENGTYRRFNNLNQPGNRVLTITTLTPVVKTIKNAIPLANAMIEFYDTKNLVIDGRVNGTGHYLKFVSVRTDAANSGTTVLIRGSQQGKCLLRNTILEGNVTRSFLGVLNLGSSSKAENNIIRHTPGFSLPVIAVYMTASTTDTSWLVNNDITNFSQTGVRVEGSGTSPAVIIDSNHFYFEAGLQSPGSKKVIDLNSGALRAIIVNNYIGGSARYCGGNPWLFTTPGGTVDGMYIIGSYTQGTSIQNNTIANIRLQALSYQFTGMTIGAGNTDIGTEKPNRIGSAVADSSIVNISGPATGIYGYVAVSSAANPTIRIDNNEISGMAAASVAGISFETKNASFRGNRVFKLKGNAVTGMYTRLTGGIVEANQVTDLLSPVTTASNVIGISVSHSSTDEIIISRNKISGLELHSASGGVITGIRAESGRYLVHNNQVNLTNNLSSAPVEIRGISLEGYGGTTRISQVYYNTIRIGGTAGAGASKSYSVKALQNFPLNAFRNNLLYNERTGGTGSHFALGSVTATNPAITTWPAKMSTNNLFIVRDTTIVNEWRASGAVSLQQWRTLSAGDTASYAEQTNAIPSDRFFANAATGNLNVNPLDSISWYSNGKGLPVTTISADFDSASNARSTTLITGATDIGADEFNTSTTPLSLKVSGSHSPGGTEYFSFAGRILASIAWHARGSLPQVQTARFYSGTWPNDTLNNNTVFGAHYLNGYWNIPATGGSNYTYDLTLHYDSSMLGKVTDASSMVINKKQSAVPGSWIELPNTVVNTALKTITVSNQTSFSEFTATDSSATLANDGKLADIVITSVQFPSSVQTGSNNPITIVERNDGTTGAPAHTIDIYVSTDNVLTPGLNGDTVFVSVNAAALAATGGTRSYLLQLNIPCIQPTGNYTLFVVADANNTLAESNKANNTATQSLTITAGSSIPVVPVITSNPGLSVCQPSTVQLTAGSAGCNSCVYTWSTGESGASITVAASGSYTVTATNNCGTAGNEARVTIKPLPVVGISANDVSVCQGDSVTLTANGATGYTWTGPGLNNATGASVKVKLENVGDALFSVTGTTANCSSAPKTITITAAAPPDVNIVENDTSICNNASITLNATGASLYSWLPSTGLDTDSGPTVVATPAVTTKYIVTGESAAGCTRKDSINISLLPLLVPSVDITYNGCPSNTLNFAAAANNAGNNPQFEWFVNDVTAGTGASFILTNATNNTKVRCKLVSDAICANPTFAEDSVQINCIVTALPDMDGLEDFYLSPNPASTEIAIYLKLTRSKVVSFELFTAEGRKLLEKRPGRISGTHIQKINISKFSEGIYFLKTVIEKRSFVTRFMKVR